MKKIFFLLMTLGWLSALNAQWIEQNSGTTENLNDVFCITADTVVVVGDNGTILRTTNGGTLWSPVTSPASVNLHRVEFADAQTGYAVGDNGTLLKTTDAGQTWQSLNTGTTENLLALSCVAADTLYVAGTNGLMLKSVDGGVSWTTITIGTTSEINDISFVNNTEGYFITPNIINDNINFFKTQDGGNQWQSINLNGLPDVYKELFTTNTSEIYIGGLASGFYSNDQGNNFISVQFNDIGSINAFDKTTDYIWTGGQDNRMGSTSIGYITAFSTSDNTYYNFFDDNYFFNSIFFINDNIGYVVGSSGIIRKNITGNNINGIKNANYNSFKISPNPAKNQVVIKLKDKITQYPVQYRIVDLEGKELIPFTALQTGKPIDVSRLTNGIYLIQVQTQGQVYTQKLLIQK